MFPGVGAGARRARCVGRSEGARVSRGEDRAPASRTDRSRASRSGRSGRVRAWIPLLLALAAGVWVTESLSNEVWAASFTTVDTRRARVLDPDERLDPAAKAPPTAPTAHGFVDARWEAMLRTTLARVAPFD